MDISWRDNYLSTGTALLLLSFTYLLMDPNQKISRLNMGRLR